MRRTSPDRLYDAYIFDMDGTIYLGDDLLPGAKRLIEGLRELGRPVRFLSNNPTKDPQLYLESSGKLGIPTPIEEIANTVVTTVRWLKANHPDAVVFPISEEPLKKALAEAGIAMSEDPEKIDIVIASYAGPSSTGSSRSHSTPSGSTRGHSSSRPTPDRYCPLPGRGAANPTPPPSWRPSKPAPEPSARRTWASPRPPCFGGDRRPGRRSGQLHDGGRPPHDRHRHGH